MIALLFENHLALKFCVGTKEWEYAEKCNRKLCSVDPYDCVEVSKNI